LASAPIPGAHDVAVRQHDFHAAVRVEVVAHRRVAATAFQRVADQTSPTGIGRIDPQLQLLLLNVAIQIEVADAGLDQGVVVLLAHLDDAVHPLEIETTLPVTVRRRAAVAEILAGGDRPQRNPVLARDADDLLDLLDAIRRDGGGRDPLLGSFQNGE
jgi:hypothetical protein